MDTLAQCFKGNIGPHFAIDKAIGHEKKYFKKLSISGKLKIWFIVLLASLLPFTLYTFDVSTDGLLVDEYDSEEDLYQSCENLNYYLANNCSMDSNTLKNLADIPSGLSTEACFNYSLAFVLFPIIGFTMEWYSDYKGMLKTEVNIYLHTLRCQINEYTRLFQMKK